MATMFIRVCTYTGDVINLLCSCASWCSVWVSFISCYSMPSGSLTPRVKAQERIACLQWVCLPRKHAFMRLSTYFGRSIPTTAYQTFLFGPDIIKLGRACSIDVYSTLRTKAEIFYMILWRFMPFMWTVDRHISMPLILPRGLCYNYVHVRTVCTRRSLSPPPRLGVRLGPYLIKQLQPTCIASVSTVYHEVCLS